MSRKLCCLTLFVCMSLAGSAMFLQSLDQPKAMLKADGGGPVPPWPSGSTPPDLLLRADGGGPVPPWPGGTLAA